MIRTLLLLSLVAGCTETIRINAAPLDGLVDISVSPSDAVVTVTDLAPPEHTLQYVAIGTFADGTTRDISSLVGWSIDNVPIGAFDGNGLFTATQTAAGHGTVTVRTSGLTATSTLTVVIDATIVDTTFPPPGANLFDGTIVDGGANAPVITYPAGGTRFPQGLASTLFQYGAQATAFDAYRVRFDSDVLHLRIETGADRWLASGALQTILETSGTGAPLMVTVDGAVSSGDGTVYASAAAPITYSHDRPDTPLFFWSASTNGIMRGTLGSPSSSKLYPASTTCVGCHALSRNAGAMAMGYDNTTSTDLETIDMGSLAPTIPATTRFAAGWSTWSPTGDKLVVANNGVLTLLDAATGASLGRVPLPPMKFGTHPDWSPDGKSLAFTYSSSAPTNMDVKQGSIATMSYANGVWGTVNVIVTSSPSINNYMPRWSPDGTYLAFVRATTTSHGATSAELLVVHAAGGTPINLATANHRVGQVDTTDQSNLMPAWGPPQPEHAWLAFVSSRAYGDVLATGGRPQIWVTSLDPDAPSDSSTPAFWLPCQDVTVLNNNPVWASQVLAE